MSLIISLKNLSLNVTIVLATIWAASGQKNDDTDDTINWSSLCDRIDESVQMSDKRMYFFSGQYYWQIDRSFRFISAPTYIQNKWGFHVKPPLDAVFTFNRGRFANKTIFISGNKWWRVTANGGTDAGNQIQWQGWPQDITADTAFLWDIPFKPVAQGSTSLLLKSRPQDSLVFFIFGSKYSVYSFSDQEKAMLEPTPLVVMADAVVSDVDNELLFLKMDSNATAVRTLSSLLEVTASMNDFDDNSLYLFGKDSKFCKINTNDSRLVCEVNKINQLLKCNTQLSNVPKGEPPSGANGLTFNELFDETNGQIDSNGNTKAISMSAILLFISLLFYL